MTQDERNTLFTRTLKAAETLRATRPDSRVLQSIEQQLHYLIGAAAGTLPADRLDEITVGLLAVREIEGWDDQLADLLHACSAEVEVMQREAALAGVVLAKSP